MSGIRAHAPSVTGTKRARARARVRTRERERERDIERERQRETDGSEHRGRKPATTDIKKIRNRPYAKIYIRGISFQNCKNEVCAKILSGNY